MLSPAAVWSDLAASLNRLVYRDIKPEVRLLCFFSWTANEDPDISPMLATLLPQNIGFDVRGDVKVFDFGLCKDLDPRLKAKDGGYGYRLTGRAGSLPYSKSTTPRL